MADLETDTVITLIKRKIDVQNVKDRPTREPAEHPDRIPAQEPVHPVTGRTPGRDDRPR